VKKIVPGGGNNYYEKERNKEFIEIEGKQWGGGDEKGTSAEPPDLVYSIQKNGRSLSEKKWQKSAKNREQILSTLFR